MPQALRLRSVEVTFDRKRLMIQAPKFIYGEEKNVFRDALRVRPTALLLKETLRERASYGGRLVERNTASVYLPLNLFMGIINFDF